MTDLVGKRIKDDKNNEYEILNLLSFKNIPCVYTQRIEGDNATQERNFFQVVNIGEEPSLVAINSKKMISALNESLVKETKTNEKPRKINAEESIPDYLAYLDEFYKSKIVTNI